ncbi:60s ribosomal protein l27, partial [Moniliophthora roreri]
QYSSTWNRLGTNLCSTACTNSSIEADIPSHASQCSLPVVRRSYAEGRMKWWLDPSHALALGGTNINEHASQFE